MNAPVFASLGPAGHRARMRERLLTRGGDGLADYEILEMLLFVGLPRGDTKPLAKALINRFGSLEAVVAAPPRALADAGLPNLRAILPLRLVEATAERLTRAEIRARPILGHLAAVEDHLRATAGEAAGTRILLLDNRNRLLADEPATLNAAAEVSGDPAAERAARRACLRRALAVHATALLVADHGVEGDVPTAGRAASARELRAAAALLSVVVHDRVLLVPSGLVSYRRAGLLA